MLETIKMQKTERDRLLSIKYTTREILTTAKDSLKNDLVKVLTGPRRAGKSILGLMMLKDTNFAYLNFDDEQLLKTTNYDQILDWCQIVYPNFEYLFLDEIQNLPDWELWVNKLARRGYKLVITGSNAKLLDGELATHLTGRYQQIEVWPMSWAESNSFDTKTNLQSYMFSGGYPEIIVKKVDPSNYLQTLFEATLFKDVVKRFNIRHTEEIYNLAKYLISQFSDLYSYRQLAKINQLSVTTAQKYVGYLEQTYLFLSLPRFDFKYKKQLGYNKKMYVIDTGMITANANQNSQNLGKILENIVLTEWLRRGKSLGRDLFYYKTQNDKEIDFLAKDGPKITQLMQVSWDITDTKTLKREISALIEAGEELKCTNLTLLTYIKPTDHINGIKIQSVEEWLNG